MTELVRRAEATERVLAKFRRRPFDWRTGGTCLHLARAQLLAMGHRPPPIPSFRSALGARRAMKKAGFADLSAMLASLGLMEIAPARMLVGDLAVLPGDEDFQAIGVWSGRQLLAYHEADASGVHPVEDALASIVVSFRL